MASESPVSLDELDFFTKTPSANLTTGVPQLSSDLCYNSFEKSFNYPFTDDGVGSAESALSTPHTAISLETSSVPTSRQAEDIFGRSTDHHQPQSYHVHFDGGEVSKDMEGISDNLGISFPTSSISNIIPNPLGGDFLRNGDCDFSEQPDHYTFVNQSWPASSRHSNNASDLQDVTCGLEHPRSNDFSNQVSWNAIHSFAPVSQTPVCSFDQEPIVQSQVFTPLMGNQDGPRIMVSYPSIELRHMNAIQAPNMAAQEINSQYSNTLDTCFERPGVPSSSVSADSLGPIAKTNLYANFPNKTHPVQDNVWPPNIVVSLCYENSPSSATQIMPTLHSGSAFNEMSENSSSSTTVMNQVHARRPKNLPILPAPSKPYPGKPHASNGLAHPQQFYGPHVAQPRRSDRRELTEKEKENVREVREISSCVVCALKKQKCDTKEICESCQKMANNPKLAAKHICFRGGILVFRQGIPDFFDANSRLGSLPRTLQGPWRTIIIGDCVTTNGVDSVLFPKNVPLTVRVREHETCDLDTTILWSEGSMRLAVTSYAIDPSTLPTASELDKWGRNLLLEYSELPDFRPYIMDKFLFAYRNARPPLKYRDLADLTISLVSLSTWLYESHPMTSIENVNNLGLPLFSIYDDRVERRLSWMARSQLLLIAAKEFEATERKILYTVDLSMRTLGCNPQDALILGLCLRRMALLYRLAFKRYKKFVIDSQIIRKREKPKAMYEALTTAYSLVYSGAKSPFSRKWSEEDNLGAFGNDRELSQLFVEAMIYDKQFCESNRDDEDDVHLKKLFLERREGGGRRTTRKDKKDGVNRCP